MVGLLIVMNASCKIAISRIACPGFVVWVASGVSRLMIGMRVAKNGLQCLGSGFGGFGLGVNVSAIAQ